LKVKIQNVSKSKSPVFCGLKDNKTLALQYKQTVVEDDSLLTDYIKRLASNGELNITQLAPSKSVDNSKGNKKPNKEKEV